MPAAPMAPAYVEASKPPAPDLEAGGGGALPVSSKAAPPPPTAVVGAALPTTADGKDGSDPFDPSSPNNPPPLKRGCGLSPTLVGWLLFALGWLLSLIWIVGLPLANALPSSCGKQSAVLLASPNPLAQLVNYERLRALVECRIVNNVSLTATGALCLIPWLLGSLLPCCCTRANRSNQQHCASLAAAKSRRSRAAAANTAMALLGVCVLAGLIAMCAVEYREAKKMDTPEQREQLESLSQVAVAGKELATGVDAVLESVGQALGIAPPPGVGSAASGDGLLGRMFKP
jgi:hypothetical protein